jgi:hypothetical protein
LKVFFVVKNSKKIKIKNRKGICKNMGDFTFLAKPWWVNILLVVPAIIYFAFKKRVNLTSKLLIFTAVFGISFGLVETAVVVYLRKIFNLISQLDSNLGYSNKIPVELPSGLLLVEIYREAATIFMLASLAIIAVQKTRERWAVFFWTFAFWDLSYYFGLWSFLKWPTSLTTTDVLFLIPVPWISQVWFPMLISVLVILAIVSRMKRFEKIEEKKLMPEKILFIKRPIR